MLAAALLAGTLAGCQSLEGPSASNPATLAGPTVPAPPEATRPTVPPIPAAQATFQFNQILGVPTNKADDLASALGRSAKARGLTLVRRGDPTASYRVLGYLSAVGGDQGVNLTYVWDVLDSNNKLLHRVTGFELGTTSSSDPWAGVSEEILSNVAARTIEGLYAWVNQVPSEDGPPAAVAAAAATAI